MQGYRREWTPEQDALLLARRATRETWTATAAALNVGRNAAIERAKLLLPGLIAARTAADQASRARPLRREDLGEDPLPPGSNPSWHALTQGTLLDGADFRAGR